MRCGSVGAGARGPALPLPPALSRGGAIGGGVVYCRWGATEGLGGAARALQCVPDGSRGGGGVARRDASGRRGRGVEGRVAVAVGVVTVRA